MTESQNIRNSSIECLRMLAMLMVVLLHANYAALGEPVREDILAAPAASFWKVLAEQICIVGVNVFVLISGWFGIRPSAKGLGALLFQVFFWGLLGLVPALVLGWKLPVAATAKLFWFGSHYWFIMAYVGLYVMAPVLNAFAEKAPRRQFLTVVAAFFLAEFIYGWCITVGSYDNGYSLISFVGLYLLARYIRLHAPKLRALRPALCLSGYGLVTLIPACVSYLGIRNGWKTFHPTDYSSPFVIAAAVFLLLAFAGKAFHSRIINALGGGVLSVYLIHEHPVIRGSFRSFMRTLAGHLSTLEYTGVALLCALAMLLACVTLDRLRVLAWQGISKRFE